MTVYHVKILRKKLVYLALICWPLIFIPTTLASIFESKAPIKIGSYLTPGLIKEDETGMFNQLNNAIFLEINKNTEITLSSLNRARRGIKNGTLDGYFPELWENLSGKREQYIVSRPFFYKRIILFTLKGSGLTELSEFEGKPLGAVQDFSYGKQIKTNPSLTLSFQKSDIVNIKLLLNNRVAGVLGGYPGTVNAVLKSNKANKIHYDLDKPVAILESFYVCRNDSDGIKLCGLISKAIQSLLKKGVLELNEETGYSRFNPLKLSS
jgi:polar amino acid transport system substrate-binding protein